MASSGYRYRIRSPLTSPRRPSAQPTEIDLPPPAILENSDSPSDSDTALEDSGREGSLTPNSRDTSLPPSRKSPRFAGLRDETVPEQAIAATIPYEIILNIFSHLDPSGPDQYSCLFVCKSWAKCAVENVWFRPATRNVASFYKLTSMLPPYNRKPTLFPYAQFVRRLNFSGIAKEITPRYFSMLSECTNLERLTMGGAVQVGDTALGEVVPKFTKLLALDISGCVALKDEGLCAIAESCRLLQGLNVAGCKDLTDKSIMAIAENCHNLRRCKLANCGSNITDEPIAVLIQNAKCLLELDITGCTDIMGGFLPETINPLIRRLSLDSVSQPRYLPALRELRLGAITSFYPDTFIHSFAMQEWASLRIIDFTQCQRLTDNDLITIVERCPRLRNVVLYKCFGITDRGLLSLATLGKYLHYLHLGHCVEITDVSLMQIARNCTRLCYLDVASCVRITDATFVEFGQYQSRLRRIGLVKCTNITDTGLIALIRGRAQICAVLERLHLSYCSRLTLNSLTNIIHFCPSLTHISLTAVPSVLRPELQALRRPVPDEFNEEQRSSFAVFSGSGVHRLKRALWALAAEQDGYGDAEF